jgi:hypothetical protein
MKRKLTTTSSGTASAALQKAAGHCAACGSQNMLEELSCRFCGNWLFDLGRCGLCGEIVATRDKRCVACGTAFDRLSPKPYIPAPAGKPRRSIWRVSGVCMLITLAIAATLIPNALSMHDASRIWGVLAVGAVFAGVNALLAWSARQALDAGVRPIILP